MKQFLLAAAAAVLALSGTSAMAQSNLPAAGADPGNKPATAAGEKKPLAARPVFVGRERQLSYVSMSSNSGKAVFTGLEGMGELKATVTNAEGRTVLSAIVSSQQNAVNVSRLKAGLYYITLFDESSERRRAFVLNR